MMGLKAPSTYVKLVIICRLNSNTFFEPLYLASHIGFAINGSAADDAYLTCSNASQTTTAS